MSRRPFGFSVYYLGLYPVFIVKLITIICCLSPHPLWSQAVRDTLFVFSETARWHKVLPQGQAAAVVVTATTSVEEVAAVLANGDTVRFSPDPHGGSSIPVNIPPFTRVTYITSGCAQSVKLWSIDANGSLRSRSQQRQPPIIVSPSVWREGLPEPVGLPTKTTIEHLIIHHSGFDAQDIGGYADVRMIYLVHTQVNGWNDIGYNYLIAPDGTIFQGRDGRGIVERDYVLGAHTCGVNEHTLGICLLGDFEVEIPETAALESLRNLLVWQTEKHGIHPDGQGIHRIGPPPGVVGHLPVIAGHRQGCADGYTTCPGLNFFTMLDQIKGEVSRTAAVSYSAFPNPTSGSVRTNFTWQLVRVYNTRAQLIAEFVSEGHDFQI